MASAQDTLSNKAGTSSCGVLRGILNNPADLQQFKVLGPPRDQFSCCVATQSQQSACQHMVSG